MTRGREFKRLVRQRMGKTGESYTSARANFFPDPQGSPASEGGGPTVNPFDRLTERAKHALDLARLEAERSGHSYIGTEHVLLGLLTETRGLSGEILRAMGLEAGAVREQIASIQGPTDPVPVQQIVPTSRVKHVIEIAYEVAPVMGHNYVGTEHLLMGLLIEGRGIAAQVLTDRGVTLAEVRAKIDRAMTPRPELAKEVLRHFPTEASVRVPWSTDLLTLIDAAQTLAEREQAEMVRADHLASALLLRRSRLSSLVSLLAACGADLDLVRRRLRVPAAVPRLQAELAETRRTRVEATARRDQKAATTAAERVEELRQQLVQALEEWQATWGERPREPSGGGPDS